MSFKSSHCSMGKTQPKSKKKKSDVNSKENYSVVFDYK